MPDKEKVLALRFVNCTGCHLFLTGRAGTGKTTLLKHIVENTYKKVVVTAPTGIAAINAGGVTLHSLFQLPLGSFLPAESPIGQKNTTIPIHTPRNLIRSIRFFEAKRRLIQELELLIIDEVSMLRADLLDAIDTLLRHIRRKRSIPFGGVQMLFIGDLLQLPPVVKNDEWTFLGKYYPSLFFFHARVLKHNPPVYIELDRIFRQRDQTFIRLLNKFRNNTIEDEDISLLNRHLQPGYDINNKPGYIYLTTHNHKAQTINEKALQQIEKPACHFEAIIKGDFREKHYPVDFILNVKEGAQVMFIKNDPGGEQRYFNGKIGVINKICDDLIEVGFNDSSPDVAVKRITWENKKYAVNPVTKEIEEEITGTFSHFPLKLAWAITIHKSQGLTFEKAVIDVSDAFAHGQIYVALSRLTGLKGLVLSKPLTKNCPGPDSYLQEYYRSQPSATSLQTDLENETKRFFRQRLFSAFDFRELTKKVNSHLHSYNQKKKQSEKQSFKNLATKLQADLYAEKATADRFSDYLQKNNTNHIMTHTYDRVTKATEYFIARLGSISTELLTQTEKISESQGPTKYLSELLLLEDAIHSKILNLYKIKSMYRAFQNNGELTGACTHTINYLRQRKQIIEEGFLSGKLNTRYQTASREKQGIHTKTTKNRQKTKTPSAQVSGQLYKEGKSIEEIADIRSLACSTIMSHMVHCVAGGMLDVDLFLEQRKLEQIRMAAQKLETTNAREIMSVLGDEFTYSDVHFALACNDKNRK